MRSVGIFYFRTPLDNSQKPTRVIDTNGNDSGPNMLFREKAVESARVKREGEVLVMPTISHRMLAMAAIAWVTCASAWLITSEFAPKETLRGWLASPDGTPQVHAGPTDNKLLRIYEPEGYLDEERKKLLRLTKRTDTSEVFPYLEGHEKHLRSYKTHLLMEIEKVNSTLQKEMAFLLRRQRSLRSEMMPKQERLDAVTAYERSVRDALAEEKMLARDSVPNISDLNHSYKKLSSLKNQEVIADWDKLSQIRLMGQIESGISMLPIKAEERLNHLRNQVSKIEHSLVAVLAREALIVRAQSSGRIEGLAVDIGQNFSPRDALLSITSDNGGRIAKLIVPVRVISSLKVGQQVDIRYSGLVAQQDSPQKGRIVKISNTLLMPNETVDFPVISQEPVYVVEAKIESWSGTGYEKSLKPGVTLTADIFLEKIAFLDLILRSLREFGRF